jgi:Raf kinase inhibitor-like YbhB/YbcL family protein
MTRPALVSALVLSVLAACSGDGVEPVIEAARQASQRSEGSSMRLTSSAFETGADIPRRFTCDGRDLSPPLDIHDIPVGATSLVLVMDDPDAPGGTWDHWVAFDIPVSDIIEEGVGQLGVAGRNTWGRTDYGGPCPPSGTHRYFFAVYALDTTLGLPAGAEKSKVLEAIEGHVLAEARLMGRYARSGG